MMSEEELEVFGEFCRLASRDAMGYVAVDPPDFVRKDAGLAVELVQYHRDQFTQGSIARKMDESAKALVEQARMAYEDRFAERLDVYVFMHHRWQPTRALVREVAVGLTEIVSRYRHEEIEIAAESIDPMIAGAISRILIGPTPEYRPESLWQYVAAAFTDVLPQAVQAALNNKEGKVNDYRKHARSVELLVYSSPWPCVGDPSSVAPSSCGIVTNELLGSLFETSFDKVHYLDRQQGKLIQLKVKRPLDKRSGD